MPHQRRPSYQYWRGIDVSQPAGFIQTATRPQIWTRTNDFVDRWRNETRERAEKDSFWNEFLAIFGVDRRRKGVFEYLAQKQSTGRHGFIDYFSPGEMAVEHKSAGENLDKGMNQLVDYLVHMDTLDLPHTLVVCDFQNFVVRDVVSGTENRFPLEQLAEHIDQFSFLAGYSRRPAHEDEQEANLEATKLLTSLHDQLKLNGYDGHALRLFLVRILYILFADDTQVWSRNLFNDWLLVHTREDGADLGSKMIELFAILDTPNSKRAKNLNPDLSEFAYVNGGLFAENLRPPQCDKQMRAHLVAASRFEWSRISPVIFGSLFQNVTEPFERRHLGAHFTSERDIMRTIRPLFLDDLEARLGRAKSEGERPGRLRSLRRLRDEMSHLTFFDPACGCGNFLMLTYRELRRVELECLLAIRENEAALDRGQRGASYAPGTEQMTFDVSLESQVRVSQFYGIEIEEFPARIAETAMHLVDHQANLALSKAFGDYYVRLPIRDTANILVDNALRIDWNTVLSADDCDYILGNPPFSGQGKMSAEQVADLELVWGDRFAGYLDHVTGWYAKAQAYIGKRQTRVALVSTNSICQGEPVPDLWEPLCRAGFHIDFAHRAFLWASEASGKAGVHVIIVGWSHGDSRKPVLYDYGVGGRGEGTAEIVSNINAYLVDAPDVFIRRRGQALSKQLPSADYGSKPVDGKHLNVSVEQFSEVMADPIAAKYVRPFIGARELIHGKERWCLWLVDADPDDIRASPVLRTRLSAVREVRLQSKKQATRALADYPSLFAEIRQPDVEYLGIPIHVGESRRYFPVQRFSADVISGNHNYVAADPDGFAFALLSSAMFITWQKGVGGRVRADPRFSVQLTWNTFPLPDATREERRRIIGLGVDVLEQRSEFPGKSLDFLYDPNATPPGLLKAHQALDVAVDRLFAGRKRVRGDRDRLEILFNQYVQMSSMNHLPFETSKRLKRR